MPRLIPAGPMHPLRAGLGAMAGIALAAYALSVLPWDAALLAPLGASSVLLFAAPASPLAQPVPVVGGNILSALCGISVAALLPWPVPAAALAVGLAIMVMMAARCLHPPGGAMALLMVLSPAGASARLPMLGTVAAGSAVLVLAAMLVHRLSGHHYPHRPMAAAAPAVLTGYRIEDLDAVLAEEGELLDISRDDLDGLIRAVEARIAVRGK